MLGVFVGVEWIPCDNSIYRYFGTISTSLKKYVMEMKMMNKIAISSSIYTWPMSRTRSSGRAIRCTGCDSQTAKCNIGIRQQSVHRWWQQLTLMLYSDNCDSLGNSSKLTIPAESENRKAHFVVLLRRLLVESGDVSFVLATGDGLLFLYEG